MGWRKLWADLHLVVVIVIVKATEAPLLKGSENTVTLFTVNKRTPKGMKCE